MPNLLIVESPGKLKTLRQILGRDWILEASVGHTTELASDGHHSLGFDILRDRIVTRYVPRGERGAQVLAGLRRAAKLADRVYLATDPDREGEAIAWHLVQQLKLRENQYVRVSYSQITEAAVQAAIRNPGRINVALVEAQRARQCLDKLVGFEVSPLLWNSTGGKSAGRVQTATLHILCERERERLAFKPESYWVLKSIYGEGFEAIYEPKRNGEPETVSEPARVQSLETAREFECVARTHPHVVSEVDSKEEQRNPPPPFITSSLQQAAGMRYRFSPKKTMEIAQQLYEGIGGKGLITYMRTDSMELSPEFTAEAATWIREHSPESAALRPVSHRVRAHAQAAHEAIRPTSVEMTPERASMKLTPDQRKIYALIWERAIASQCRPARLARAKTTVACGDTRWVARGMTVLDPGYLKFWKNTEDERTLPVVRPGQALALLDVKVDRRATEPPPRYTEPKLIQVMEKRGIGRPSTYASTLATLKDREYVDLEKNFLAPLPLGMDTDQALTEALPDLVNPDFTAKMESELDAIAEGKLPWERYLTDWNRSSFEPALAKARDFFAEFARTTSPVPERARSAASAATPSARSDVPASVLVSPGRLIAKAVSASKDRTSLAKKAVNAKAGGVPPTCPSGHGDLEFRLSSKGVKYWKCQAPGCETIAWHRDFSTEKCPECGERLEKVRSKKVAGGYFLKCDRPGAHPNEVVLFRNKKTKKWELAGSRSNAPK